MGRKVQQQLSGTTAPFLKPEDGDPCKVKAEPPAWMKKGWSWFRHHLLLALTVLAVIAGVLIGCLLSLYAKVDEYTVMLIRFPGEILLRMLKMLILPLFVSSLVAGLAQLNPKSSGRMGSKALLYYLMTTLSAIVLGIILVIAIHPGNPEIKKMAERVEQDTVSDRIESLDAFLDMLRNLVPENLIETCFAQAKTYYESPSPQKTPALNASAALAPNASSNVTADLVTTVASLTTSLTASAANQSANASSVLQSAAISTASKPAAKVIRKLRTVRGINVMGIISFCIMFGLVISNMGEKALLVAKFFCELSEVIMRMVAIIMWYSPVGIMFLVIGNILATSDMSKVVATLGLYMVTVIAGLVIHLGIVLPLIFFVCTRKNPYAFFRGCLQAFLTALGTGSSSATLPVTFRCLEENIGIDKRVTRFVLPVGATVNMDGTALYEAVAAIFIAQLNGYVLSFGDVITISLTATLASIGAASIPSAGLVTMVMVLMSVGLPPEDIGIIVSVDWFLDRMRTAVNVMGDAYGAGIINHLSRFELAKEEAEEKAAAVIGHETGSRLHSRSDLNHHDHPSHHNQGNSVAGGGNQSDCDSPL